MTDSGFMGYRLTSLYGEGKQYFFIINAIRMLDVEDRFEIIDIVRDGI